MAVSFQPHLEQAEVEDPVLGEQGITSLVVRPQNSDYMAMEKHLQHITTHAHICHIEKSSMQPEILLIADEDDVVQDTKCKS